MKMRRPHGCVRRTWHGERHQPIRGSLIKEIFRIAHEIHTPSTKMKKQWQEKLPIVVLKAEEIMYSKANSEAEYVDPKTIWERLNDAIDTMIRRDQIDETGEFLQPCIEAALNLGSIARRVSRGERNTNPRFYLGSYSLCRDVIALEQTSPPASQCPNLLNPTPLTIKNVDFGLLNADINMLPVRVTEDPADELACDLSLRLAPLSVSAPPKHETRKRRAMEVVDDHQFPWQPKLRCTYASGSPRIAGL